MCMWVFLWSWKLIKQNYSDFNYGRQNYGLLNLAILGNFLNCWVWSLWRQLLLQSSMDSFQTLYTCCGENEHMHVAFKGRQNLFGGIMAI